MKVIITIIVTVLTVLQLTAQNGVAINTTGAAAAPSAMLDVSSSTKGFLTPRMSKQERLDIVNPVRGLLVYQIDDDYGFWFFDGNAWLKANAGDNLGNHTASDSLNMDNKKIVKLATCTQNLDAANKEYVDNAVAAGGGSGMPSMISNESASTMNFGAALRYCKNLNEGGFTNWYLPTFEELTYILSIGGINVSNESSNNDIWARQINSYASNRVQSINFNTGAVSAPSGDSNNYVRCVR